jgi:hypothetical protein
MASTSAMTHSQTDLDISVTDPRHILFLQRHGLDVYNNYFNRDKKRMVVEPVVDESNWMYPPPPRPIAPGTHCSLEPCEQYKRRFDIFYDEFRDGDNAVPKPLEMKYHWVEPLESHYRFVPLEYIIEHGVLEFILESQYCYSACSLLQYSKAAEYQMMYINKLIKEGRLTSKGKVVSNQQVSTWA